MRLLFEIRGFVQKLYVSP